MRLPRLSHLLVAVLLMAAWWVWVLTAWLTDLFNPRLPVVQATVLAVMFGTLLMAIAVPYLLSTRGYGIHPAFMRRFADVFRLPPPLFEAPVRVALPGPSARRGGARRRLPTRAQAPSGPL